ncbi:hypothetical protein OF83DRAFT_1155813, partial [Amylostereum chailletii]
MNSNTIDPIYPTLESEGVNDVQSTLKQSDGYWPPLARVHLAEIDSVQATHSMDARLLYKQLGCELQHLDQIVVAIQARRAICAPVSRLPTELLCKIFTDVAAIDRPGSCENSSCPRCPHLGWIRSVTHVSRRWRHIGLDMMQLWAYDVTAIPNLPAVNTLRERAKTAPLRLSIRPEKMGDERWANGFFDFAVQEMGNANIVDVKSTDSLVATFAVIMNIRQLFPSLGHVSMECKNPDTQRHFFWSPIVAPNLTSCILRDFFIRDATPHSSRYPPPSTCLAQSAMPSSPQPSFFPRSIHPPNGTHSSFTAGLLVSRKLPGGCLRRFHGLHRSSRVTKSKFLDRSGSQPRIFRHVLHFGMGGLFDVTPRLSARASYFPFSRGGGKLIAQYRPFRAENPRQPGYHALLRN